MKVDASILTNNPLDGAVQARSLEAMGYAGGFTFDGQHDPFLPLLSAASATTSLELYTGIAVAFARNPYLLAQLAWDLQIAAQGRFTLGLGSQIRQHIERRFSMPWDKPAARMREMVATIRAIWDSWEHGSKPAFTGEFYQYTLMPSLLNPGPNPFGVPKILMAGVGPLMTQVAGEVGDGFIVHPFNSRKSLQELTLPALAAGRAMHGHTLDDFVISCQVMMAAGETAQEIADAVSVIRTQIAFYASTPAYKVVLDCHGWGDLQPQMQLLSRENAWDKMAALVSDEMLHTLAVVGHVDTIAAQLRERCGDIAGRVSLVTPYSTDPARWKTIVAALQQG